MPAKKTGLGKGLEALFNENQLTKLANGRVITCVELEGVKKELSKIWQSLNSLITRSD